MTYDDCAERPQTGWDMHCHTVFSDGTETPEELVRQAKAMQLLGVAITDHDTTSGWVPAQRAAERLGLPLLRGTEITAEFDRTSVHMLAYQYDPNSPHIASMFARTRDGRVRRAKIMVERLSEDFPITWDDVLDQVKEGSRTTIGRPHIADALVAAGVYDTRSEAFQGAVNGRSKYYVPTASPTALEVVDAVREAGGVSVVAHPADTSRNRVLLSDEQIHALVDEGLDGLEVWHRGNAPAQRLRLLALAQRYGLLTTGGSDWHGKGKPNLLGENVTDPETVARIIERGAIDPINPSGASSLD
ncbi:MAG: PHP domain-containing protein [Bifidobacterium tibiigranuli]|jgi:predicted metal-dependent phosphoesterase TrpH|uniref:PHP domain-containing protein n=1 Tax=Bifidobacterium tibiigranuli TaxID=2172043 RepID=UPI002355ABA7|nr:PHP domain-containing protein [Bifidobacterium tibiigranuli]MCH3974911.1 PHP domain-containing protein [Bifidobacterium tibiigranuli]MCH4190020.1 PHP domain-containing protein [Bifidobacterium tibiigranuli]MCH4202671.1 PHP domain-containing protein [Bifidobacterium tibiigranuli]MCH4273689.1 PHP domain-containing protein [Bifidobacterium tibiigranuli]MCI1791232.1 PHP domain-containing protein [Bifidobacterium tibiigranuli]